MIQPLTLELEQPVAPASAVWSMRAWRDNADYQAMSRVLIASRNADGLEEARTGDDLRRMYERQKNFDPVTNMFLVEAAGELVGYAGCRWWEEKDNHFVHASWIFVDPEWRGRGIEQLLLERTENRMVASMSEHPRTASNWFEVFAYDTQEWLGQVVRAAGYKPIRYFYDMVCRDLSNLPDLDLPAGIETRPVKPEHLRAIWEAEGEAFRDHWGEAIEDESDYERWLKNPLWNPELWQVAWESDQPVGMVLNYVSESENRQYNYRRGYTENISVRKPWRGRGIARALLVKSMRMFRDMGFDHTALGVDTENATGALHLYQDVGYQAVRTMTVYHRQHVEGASPESAHRH